MIDLHAASESVIAAAKAKFKEAHSIEAHPGEFDEAELRRFRVGNLDLRVAVLDVPEVTSRGTGLGVATVTMALFVICTDRQVGKRAMQALATVSEALDWLSHNQFDNGDLLAVDPKTITAQNLYSGELDQNSGIAFWGIRWQQRIKATT